MSTIQKSEFLAEVQVSYKTKIRPSLMPVIKKVQDAYELLKTLYDADTVEHTECAILILLNRAGRVLGYCKISAGGVAGTVVDSKVIFQIALGANASSIILSHNHPSGNLIPSKTDIDLTRRLKEGAAILDIIMFDHIIYTTEGFYSFANEGTL